MRLRYAVMTVVGILMAFGALWGGSYFGDYIWREMSWAFVPFWMTVLFIGVSGAYLAFWTLFIRSN